MKTLFILLLVIGCGKNINRTQRNFIVSEPLKVKTRETLPQTLTFKSDELELNLRSQRKLSFDFFESSSHLSQYFSYGLSHIHPDAIYQLKTPLPEDSELFIYDLGKNHVVDPQNIKFGEDFLERLNQQKSFFFLAFSNSSLRKKEVVIRNYQENQTIILVNSLEKYLQEKNLRPKELTLNDILTSAGDNQVQWWIKKDTREQIKLIHASLNMIQDEFHKSYRYQKHLLKRMNGQGQSLQVSGVHFLKISAKRTMQKAKLRRFSETFYTYQGELPYRCHFTEALAIPSPSTPLSNQEISNIFINKDLKSMTHNSWSELGQLKIQLPDFNAEHFYIGLIERKCPSSRGPKISKQRISTEKELELVIESYVRKE